MRWRRRLRRGSENDLQRRGQLQLLHLGEILEVEAEEEGEVIVEDAEGMVGAGTWAMRRRWCLMGRSRLVWLILVGSPLIVFFRMSMEMG